LNDDPDSVWKIPEERDMELKEFFDPSPIKPEPLTNDDQQYLNDQTDEDLESKIDRIWPDDDDSCEFGDEQDEEDGGEERSFAGRYGGETIMMIPNMGKGVDFVMSPDKFGAARGTYGMHTDNKKVASSDLLDKRSAWDILQHVIAAMASKSQLPQEKQENEENTDFPG
jgi:hypothetical protein